jgi:uracil-DNA glycosylase
MSPTLKRKGAPLASSSDAKKPKANGNIASFFGAPKPATAAAKSTSAAPNPPAVKFDKAKWVASLTEEQKDLLQLEIDTMHESWLGLLKDDIKTKEFLDLKKFLKQETNAGRKWFPPAEDVYSWYVNTEPFKHARAYTYGFAGPTTLRSTMSRSSSSDKTHTTT